MSLDHTNNRFTVRHMKAEARALRADINAGPKLSHCAALEAVARRHGFANWNTARARAPEGVSVRELRVGSGVRGRYLSCPFTGRVLGVQAYGGETFRLTLQFDRPVDVVRFDSFSAMRRRVSTTVRDDGTCLARLSTGEPHLVLDGAHMPTERA